MPDAALEERASAVRRFNRFYTRQIGVLNEHLLKSKLSLTEVRILYELAQRPGWTGSDLGRELGLNAGYLSRVIAGFQKQGFVSKRRSTTDGRVAELELTEMGRATLEPLEAASHQEVMTMLEHLSEPSQRQLIQSMAQIEGLLGEARPGYLLREPRPGDMGWVVYQHGATYAREFGWNSEFEALVAEIVAKFVREFDRRSNACWIAEKDGSPVGSVFVVRENKDTARLRLLCVDGSARGQGIGRRLLDEALRFAREAGYKTMVLWTCHVLADARRMYEKAGFRLVEETLDHSFGKDLVNQEFSLTL